MFEIDHFHSALNLNFLVTSFQKAVIQRQIEILTWNQSHMKFRILNFQNKKTSLLISSATSEWFNLEICCPWHTNKQWFISIPVQLFLFKLTTSTTTRLASQRPDRWPTLHMTWLRTKSIGNKNWLDNLSLVSDQNGNLTSILIFDLVTRYIRSLFWSPGSIRTSIRSPEYWVVYLFMVDAFTLSNNLNTSL